MADGGFKMLIEIQGESDKLYIPFSLRVNVTREQSLRLILLVQDFVQKNIQAQLEKIEPKKEPNDLPGSP